MLAIASRAESGAAAKVKLIKRRPKTRRRPNRRKRPNKKRLTIKRKPRRKRRLKPKLLHNQSL